MTAKSKLAGIDSDDRREQSDFEKIEAYSAIDEYDISRATAREKPSRLVKCADDMLTDSIILATIESCL